MCLEPGISSLRAVRVLKQALEKGVPWAEVVCEGCKDCSLADKTPEPHIAWQLAMVAARDRDYPPQCMLLNMMRGKEWQRHWDDLLPECYLGWELHHGEERLAERGLDIINRPTARECGHCKFMNTNRLDVLATPLDYL